MMESLAKRPRIDSEKSPSSSGASLHVNFHDFDLLQKLSPLGAEESDKTQCYNLFKLLEQVSVVVSDLPSSLSSEALCGFFFDKVVGRMKDVKITIKNEVPQFANLYPLYCSTDQRPDLTVSRKSDNLPLILVEVHSSPFAATVKKTILGVTDQLRLYRTYNASITHCVGFAFPKPGVDQCVVKVSVTWEEMCFNYALTPIENISDVMKIVATELHNATKVAPSTDQSQELQFVVRLSQEDLLLFCDGANGSLPVQVQSRASILVRHGMDYFKSPAHMRDRCQLLEVEGHIPPAAPTIKLQQVSVENKYFFKYRGIPYGPLTRTEAQSCLYDLVPKPVQVMTSLHKSGWAHQDIRLENICFDESCSPVFIDLDRCRRLTQRRFEGGGCMYNNHNFISSIQADWSQLGLMVCWVLDPRLGQEEGVGDKGTYHTRDCNLICQSLKDGFLKSLIGEGKFEQDQLHAWCNNKETKVVEVVLRQRRPL